MHQRLLWKYVPLLAAALQSCSAAVLHDEAQEKGLPTALEEWEELKQQLSLKAAERGELLLQGR